MVSLKAIEDLKEDQDYQILFHNPIVIPYPIVKLLKLNF